MDLDPVSRDGVLDIENAFTGGQNEFGIDIVAEEGAVDGSGSRSRRILILRSEGSGEDDKEHNPC